MKRIYFLLAVFVPLLVLLLASRLLVGLRPIAQAQRGKVSEVKDIEAVEDRARRGAEDTAPILHDPNPTFDAQSAPALVSPAKTNFRQPAAAEGVLGPTAVNAGPTWVAIGPSPIPNGQTDPANANGISQTQSPVSGRTTAIAIDPTNPNIAYAGTAQGGVYRTLNGGASWTPLLDGALALAVGSVKIVPKDRTKVLVGTGGGNFSGDSYVGAGVYLITGADGPSPTWSGHLIVIPGAKT